MSVASEKPNGIGKSGELDSAAVRERLVCWDDPALVSRLAASSSGIDLLRASAAGEAPLAPFLRLIGFRVDPDELEPGRVAFTFQPAEYHYNGFGVAHGGVALALLDSALGCAVHSTLAPGARYTTLETSATFTRALHTGVGRVRCEGKVVHTGRTIASAEARAVGVDDDRVYAHGKSTCLIFGERTPS